MGERPLSIEKQLRRAGYSQEELYFYQLNRDLIEKRRAQPTSVRDEMFCPNCGQQLGEANILGIQVARCPDCGGVYLRPADVETLVATRSSHAFLSRLKKLFKPPEEAQLF